MTKRNKIDDTIYLNIKKLLKITGSKMSDLEKYCKVSAGFFSRGDCDRKPFCVIQQVSDFFCISLDELSGSLPTDIIVEELDDILARCVDLKAELAEVEKEIREKRQKLMKREVTT